MKYADLVGSLNTYGNKAIITAERWFEEWIMKNEAILKEEGDTEVQRRDMIAWVKSRKVLPVCSFSVQLWSNPQAE